MLKNTTLLLSFLIILASCQSKKNKLTESILKLETSDSSSTPNGFNQLADLYFDYAKSFPKDSASELYLYKGFMFKYLTKHWDDAIKYGNFYKSTYVVNENYHQINLKLADVYGTGKGNTDSALKYYLLADHKVQFSTDEYRKASQTLVKWVRSHQGSDRNPGLLYLAAQYLQRCGDFTESVALYSELTTNYPTFEKCPDALMAAGFISWNNLKQIEEAKGFYTKLSEKYPDSPLAKEAKMIVSENILTMSELELADYLSKKSKETDKPQ
jgi:tetratricopeptide (TPR) repeat protein